MRFRNFIGFGISCWALFFLVACGQQDLLSQMKEMIPIFQGANIIDSYNTPGEKMSVIRLEVATKNWKGTQKEILDYYKNTMTQKGWEFKKLKDYGKNGSVMELVKKDFGTLAVQTICKKSDKTGKIPVVLNLSTT
jgi:hypothetical protein